MAMEKRDDLPALWDMLKASKDNNTLLKQYLTQDLYDKLKDKKTRNGGSLADCIRTGCLNPSKGGVGLRACDPEAYMLFAPLLDEVTKTYHQVISISHPQPEFGNPDQLKEDLDLSREMILSTRVRIARSHEGFGFPPVLTKRERLMMEEITVEALKSLEGELQGTYYPLTDMPVETKEKLIADHFLFRDNNSVLLSASVYDDWPSGRGIFFTPDKRFLVWVNEEDHLRFISMQKGGNLREVYGRLVKATKQLEKKLTFAYRDNFGYLTFCPTNLGTTLRASVHIKIPNLSSRKNFKDICDTLQLQARGIDGDRTAPGEGGIYDISNKRRLGLTEIEAVMEMEEGVNQILQIEREMAEQ